MFRKTLVLISLICTTTTIASAAGHRGAHTAAITADVKADRVSLAGLARTAHQSIHDQRTTLTAEVKAERALITSEVKLKTMGSLAAKDARAALTAEAKAERATLTAASKDITLAAREARTTLSTEEKAAKASDTLIHGAVLATVSGIRIIETDDGRILWTNR